MDSSGPEPGRETGPEEEKEEGEERRRGGLTSSAIGHRGAVFPAPTVEAKLS